MSIVYGKVGVSVGLLELGIETRKLKNKQSSTQFVAGPILQAQNIAIRASIMQPKTPPELAAPNRALWSI